MTKIYLRYRNRTGGLNIRRPVALKLDGLVLHGTWRNGPATVKSYVDTYNGQIYSTKMSMVSEFIQQEVILVTSDEQDESHLYFRLDDYNLKDGGKLLYRQRNCTGSSACLRTIQTNYLAAGGTGRLKYALVDFDNDGLLDMLLGTSGYHAIPSNKSGLPACSRHETQSDKIELQSTKCTNNGATVLLMRQTNQSKYGIRQHPRRGKPASVVFEWPEWITVKGKRIFYGGQEIGVAPFDRGDGKISLMVATPGGAHVFWAADDITTSTKEPPVS